jgi:hypothetical protein
MTPKVICDSSNNGPEVIAKNELHATIIITPFKWANDESYEAWYNPAVRLTKEWGLNELGEIELVGN